MDCLQQNDDAKIPPQQQQQINLNNNRYQPSRQAKQQPPPQQGHEQHNHAHATGDLLKSTILEQERSHLQEHMDITVDVEKMSEDELQFYFFKMYDNDNNSLLDGCELSKSMMHWHDDDGKFHADIFKDSDIAKFVDLTLNNNDYNRDGFISYPEYKRRLYDGPLQQYQLPNGLNITV